MPVGSVPQYFWFIISSVGGCEKVQEAQEQRLLKSSTGTWFTFYICSGLQVLFSALFTEVKWYFVVTCSFLQCCLPQGKKKPKHLFALLFQKHKTGPPPSYNQAVRLFSSNKKLQQQSRLHLLRDKPGSGIWEWSFSEPHWSALSSGVLLIRGRNMHSPPARFSKCQSQ